MDQTSRSRLNTLHESSYEALVQAVVDYAIYMLDPNGEIISWNAGAERIKGYRADEAIGQHFSMFFTPEDRAAGLPQKLLGQALETGVAQDEGWRMRKDGTRFWALAALDVVRDANGRVIGLAKITRDITDRHEAAIELDKVRAQLFQSQKLEALGQLTGGMAHDFNNVLTIIMGSARLAMNSKDPQRVQKLLQHILDAGERGTQLTRQLLTFARRRDLQVSRISLPQLIESTQLLIKQALPETIELKVELSPDLHEVELDPSQLEMVLLNVIFNARDALEDAGTITLQASNCTLNGELEQLYGDFVQISISDNGRGIDEQTMPRIFEPFFTTKGFGKGTGLGLSQVYGFTRQSNGCVKVQSEVGKGTTLTLYLPARRG
ncbi:two-component system sensor histidine kinase NtrB [Pseudomonas akapageensis]|uniref:two-component system sensor histidine kinase NtrB n=1 Tax=Pseudomonas akapageensis TaxID=2609961 RepID=UPI00140920F0|nr:ATP-binding protein [Pseudomonas akapageensis]